MDEVEAWLRLKDDLSAKLATAQSNLQGFGSAALKVGAGLTAALTLPILGVGGASIKMAMDAIESENLFEVSFGKMADSARRWSEDLSGRLGLNQFELRRTSATLFTMFDSMGIGEKAAFGMSTGISELSADMASFFNLRPEDAFEKIRAGIVGEAEPLKRLGILVDENTVKMTAYKHGLIAQGAEMSAQQKVLARYLAIMDQTKKAQGDLARTLDSPTNQLRIMKERLNETAIAFGMALMPVVQQFIGVMGNMMPHIESAVKLFTNLSPALKTTIIVFAGLAAAIGPLLVVVGTLITSFYAVLPLLTALGPAIAVLTGPLGLVVAAVGLAIAVWKNWDIIGPIVKGVYTAVKTWLVDMLGAAMAKIRAPIDAVIGMFQSMKDTLVGHSTVPEMSKLIQEEFKRMGGGMSEETKKAQKEIKEAFKDIQASMVPLTAAQRASIIEWEKMGVSTSTMAKSLGISDLAIQKTIKNFETMKTAIDVVHLATVDFGTMFPAQMRLATVATERQAIALGVLKESVQHVELGLGNLGQFAVNEMPPKISTFWSIFQKDANQGLSGLTKDLKGLTGTFMEAFTGGGGALGAVKAFATGAAEKLLGMIPLVGPFLSKFAGPLIAGIGKIGSAIKNLFGGPDKDEIAGRDVVDKFSKNLSSMLTESQRIEAGNEQWKQTVIAIRDAYIAQGLTVEQALKDSERLWASSRQSSEESKRVVEEITRRMGEFGGAARRAIEDIPDEVHIRVVAELDFPSGGYDIPGYQHGGPVRSTGLALLHEGEFVIPRRDMSKRVAARSPSEMRSLLAEITGLRRDFKDVLPALVVGAVQTSGR